MLSSLGLIVVAAVSIDASSAQSLLESARALQAERWATVRNYTTTISVEASGGMETSIYYEKMEVNGEPTFRMVPPAEYSQALVERAGYPPAGELLTAMAPGLDMLGDALVMGGGDMPAMDVRAMTGQMSAFARAAATGESSDGRAEATDAMNDFAQFAGRARLMGTEDVIATTGEPALIRSAYLLMADGLSDVELEQPEGDAKFSVARVSLWMDTEHLVPYRLLMEGEVEARGKTSPLTIEKLDLDYRRAGPLYESRRQVYKLSGLLAGLSDKEKKEMEKAKAEFERAKAQLESMPPQQRAMVEKMMKGQMEKFESMAAGDAITTTTDVKSIAINEGPPTAMGPGDLTVGGPAAAVYPGALTIAADDPGAELAIAARLPGGSEAVIGLLGAVPFPQSGSVEITGASGHAYIEGGARVSIEEGSGTITVTHRTATRIVGTFTALLTGHSSTSADNPPVQFSAEGSFDCGAPVGPLKKLRGSPIPVDLFDGP